MKVFDIGANLTDAMFKGVYNGKQVHVPDIGAVLKRAVAAGVSCILVTAGTPAEVEEAGRLCAEHSTEALALATTVGVHPTRCNILEDDESAFNVLCSLLRRRSELRIRSLGEFGLDYERLQFCPADIQRRWFARQLDAFAEMAPDLPLFLHLRGDAVQDFFDILGPRRRHFTRGGVVHSFTGNVADALRIVDELDLCVGLNGCSLRTQEGLDVAAALPLDRILVDSDAPYCDIRPSSPARAMVKYTVTAVPKERYNASDSSNSIVKGRNEPLGARQVVEVIAAIKGQPLDLVADAIFATSVRTFGNLN